ncbi:hypothetical protein KI387_040304 [Taxus chinensis]|uniref:Dof-type domain-containing protein n=1 Tax=Taxus chinensis TaxID=29808 RepID=A0AA38C8T3_TAXCH|nr:hypothetical protein KI387_040304 [Taxus chinensis]
MQDSGCADSVLNGDVMAAAVVESSSRLLTDRRAKPLPPAQALKCPRCDSMNTKFCYYNNYNLSQPRHFCKSCRRYWTKGGSLRNVPVGGGCRKNKRSNKHKSSGDDQRNGNNSAEKTAGSKPVSSSDKAGGASSSSSSLVNNNNNNIQDGSDRSECNTNNNSSAVSRSFTSGQVFNTDLHQPQLLNSGNSLSSISYENPQFSINPTVFSGSVNWGGISPLDLQWKQQQSLTSLLTDGRASFDGSAIAEPPPLLEDITSIGEAAISRFLKATPASWPSLLQDQNNNNNNHNHAFDWQTNSINNNSEGSFLSDLAPWSGGTWPDLGNYGPGTSLP